MVPNFQLLMDGFSCCCVADALSVFVSCFFFFLVVGVLAVAMSKKKADVPSHHPSLILFYTLSEPAHPQVWKRYDKDPLNECRECSSLIDSSQANSPPYHLISV